MNTHTLQIISLAETPAATCSCGKFGYVSSSLPSDTVEQKQAHMQHTFENHVAECADVMIEGYEKRERQEQNQVDEARAGGRY